MKRTPTLSIIVPIYNVEAYLSRCIDSILAQTFTDFELILIDDGSPDRCAEIMEEYAAKDSRIVTIHQKNGGVSAARNAGLRAAKGEYVGFVDPDDWIEPEMYEKLVSTMTIEDVELVCCNVFKAQEDGTKRINTEEVLPFYLSQKDLLFHVIKYPSTINGWSFNKLYRRNLIRESFDETIKICEDTKFVMHYCKAVQRACYLADGLYNYFIRSNSAMFANRGAYALGMPVKRELSLELYDSDRAIAEYAEDDYLDSCCLCIQYTAGTKDEYYVLARKELTSYVRTHLSLILHNRKMSIKKKIYVFLYTIKAAVELQTIHKSVGDVCNG